MPPRNNRNKPSAQRSSVAKSSDAPSRLTRAGFDLRKSAPEAYGLEDAAARKAVVAAKTDAAETAITEKKAVGKAAVAAEKATPELFAFRPSVGSWLLAPKLDPIMAKASVVEGAEAVAPGLPVVLQEATESFFLKPSVGSWLSTPPGPIRSKFSLEEPEKATLPEGVTVSKGFALKPSVGSWLIQVPPVDSVSTSFAFIPSVAPNRIHQATDRVTDIKSSGTGVAHDINVNSTCCFQVLWTLGYHPRPSKSLRRR
mmetsp:Transcript_8174/g.17322  ORF Transcript_8174/g.17322 Transcript_8174/m.17322 type:complete len:256 (+) Transcript_8174:72-839(+)